MPNLLKALHLNLKSIPLGFNFLLRLINHLLFITRLSCLWVAQNTNIHGLVVLSPWPFKMSRMTTGFTYFQMKPMLVVQMLMK